MRESINRIAQCVVAFGCVAAAGVASAGVIDSPLPSGMKHIFTVPGVIKNNNVQTEFVCTNLDAVTVGIGVEVFSAIGGGPLNDVAGGNGDGTIAPGATFTLGTNNTAAIHEDEVINLNKCLGGTNAGALCTVNADCNSNVCTALRCNAGPSPNALCASDVDCGGTVGSCAPPLRNGSARIVSESKRIVCNAFLVDNISSPPASMATLKVMKPKKQSGD